MGEAHGHASLSGPSLPPTSQPISLSLAPFSPHPHPPHPPLPYRLLAFHAPIRSLGPIAPLPTPRIPSSRSADHAVINRSSPTTNLGRVGQMALAWGGRRRGGGVAAAARTVAAAVLAVEAATGTVAAAAAMAVVAPRRASVRRRQRRKRLSRKAQTRAMNNESGRSVAANVRRMRGFLGGANSSPIHH